ncbi:MAG: sulfite exporter TauE/SafE family protein [Burkholderiaceae bacterium]
MSAEFMLLVLGAGVAGFVQGMSGFAFGMVAMSFWVWGIEPGLAAVMSVFGGLTGQLLSAATVRRGLHLKLLLPFLAGGVVGVPIGVWALPHLNPSHFKLALGTMLLVCCPAMLLAPRLPPVTRGGRLGDAAAGAVGGLMGGIGGFTGVVPALWCTLRGYDKDAHRAVLQNFNLAALAATMVALMLSGAVRSDMWPKFAVVAPALILPSMLGARVYLGLSPAAFRRLILCLLSLSGVAMMAAALVALFRP